MSAAEMATVTPEAAIAHPNWKMGPKVSLDCATLVNKGLEYIEACMLFPVTPEQIDVVIHPESIVHSLVCYKDGSTLAQLGHPDMRTPIAFSLAYPERVEIKHKALNLHEIGMLRFSAPDYNLFPMLKMAMQSMRAGLAQRIVLNAANEEAGQAFLMNKIKFPDIARLVGNALEKSAHKNPDSIAGVLGLDKMIRDEISSQIAQC
jgi:1-deoxy-D-xylulose-5-phosphate reductoisomerase